MVPRSERGAIEKMYRVRRYLLQPIGWLEAPLTLAEHVARMQALELCYPSHF
jgi:hypothetical protein